MLLAWGHLCVRGEQGGSEANKAVGSPTWSATPRKTELDLQLNKMRVSQSSKTCSHFILSGFYVTHHQKVVHYEGAPAKDRSN